MFFDPSQRRLVGVLRFAFAAIELVELGSTETAWTEIPSSLPAGAFSSLAFEARNGALVGLGGGGFNSGGAAWELPRGASTWNEIGTPGHGVVFANPQRGTVQFASDSPNLWERSGASWSELDAMPAPLQGTPIYFPRTNETAIIGNVAGSRMIFRRRFVGSGAEEACATPSSMDLDGDGLAGCEDPDCWWSCHPSCPPYVTCP